MDTCGLAYSARVTPNPARKKIHVKGKAGGACVIMSTGHVSLMGFKHPEAMYECFARGLSEAGLGVNDVLTEPIMVNATYKLSTPLDGPIDLQNTAMMIPGAKYNRELFPGITIKGPGRSNRCTLFENGQLVVTGVKSKEEGHRVLQGVVDGFI